MSNWKKIIVSGSNAHLNNISASGAITGSIITSSNLNPLLHFNGNRAVSNDNLPSGIYLNNFGTEGNLSNFIEAVFFTNTPPEIPFSQSFSIQEWEVGTKSLGFVNYTDDEVNNPEITQFITMSIEANPFFNIGISTGELTLKNGIRVSESINIHPSESALGTIYTYPLDVTATDSVGVSDTEKIYIHVIPNEKPIIKDYNNASITTLSTSEVNEHGNVKTIYEYTSSAINESSFQYSRLGGFSLKTFDHNEDTVRIVGQDTHDQIDINGDRYVNFGDITNQKQFRFLQQTSSFDYESSSFFNFTITASDEHYPTYDTRSVVYIKYHLPITDNLAPTLADQSFTINENSADDTEVTNSPINIVDNDGQDLTDGTAFFLISNFTLQSVSLVLGGADIKDTLFEIADSDYFNPTKDPFKVDPAGRITRKSGAFLNADIAKYYVYQASVTDIFNENQDTNQATMIIEVLDDTLPTVTLSHATNNYIIESALTSNFVVSDIHGDNNQGSTSTFALSDQDVNWKVNQSPLDSPIILGAVNITGTTTQNLLTSSMLGFKPATNISESIYTFDAGTTINVGITASKNSFPSSQTFKDFTLNIAKNHSPEIITTPNSLITAFSLATEGETLYSLSFTDQEQDNVNFGSFTLRGPQLNTLSQLSSSNNGSTLSIQCRNNLSASTTYNFTASIQDVHGFRTSSISRSFTINPRNTGVFSQTAGSYYLIESAVAGASVVNNSSGVSGTAVSFSVDYSSGDVAGAPTVQSFTASVQNSQYIASYPGLQNMFSISSGSIGAGGGLLTIRENISESIFNQDTNDGDAVVIKVTYQDQYGNFGQSGNIFINPVDNLAPIISNETDFSSNYTDFAATNNTILKQYNINDPEGDTIPTNIATLFPDTTNGLTVENNATNLTIKASQQLTVGAYHFTASISDIHNFRTSSVSGTINIVKETGGILVTNNDSTFNGNVGLKSLYFIEEDGRDNDIIHAAEGEFDSGGNNPLGLGDQAHLTVDYGSTGLSLQGFSISSPQADINETNGLLSLGQDISGSNNNGGFSPTQIANGTAIISASITFTDNNPAGTNSITDHIYIKIFQNASRGILTANNNQSYNPGGGNKALFFVQECGRDNNFIHTQTGETNLNGNGNQADLGGLYRNLQNESIGLIPTNFSASSNPHVKINSSNGKLILGKNISGSNNNGGFSPTEIANGNAIFPVQVAFNDSTSNNITIHDTIYVQIFQNASLGTLTRNAGTSFQDGKFQFFIQECAKLGDAIHTETGFHDTLGIFEGSQAQLGVDYTPTGLAVNNFSVVSSTPKDVDINSSTGILSIGENISGSVSPGDLITVNISFTDNGPSSVTLFDTIKVKVFANDAPNFNTNEDYGTSDTSLPLNSGHTIRRFTITDKEHDYFYTASLLGADANLLRITSASNPEEGDQFYVKTNQTIANDASNQQLSYTVLIQDSVGKSHSEDFTTNFSLAPNKVFAYSFRTNISLQNYAQNWIGGINFFGTTNSDHLNPDAITNVLTGSVLAHFQSGSLGSTFTPAYVYSFMSEGATAAAASSCVLIDNADLTQLKGSSGIKSLGVVESDNNDHLVLFVFPSSSTLNHKPNDIDGSHNYTGGDTADSLGKYKLRDAASPYGNITGNIIYFNTSESYFGHNTWGMIHTRAKNYASEKTYELINTPSAGDIS